MYIWLWVKEIFREISDTHREKADVMPSAFIEEIKK